MGEERRTIHVGHLARVEGEGALHVRLREGRVEEVRLEIFESPRFFEALLVGRDFREAPDITARICGICPIAYLLGAARAMESVCRVELPEELEAYRRLIYTGEWIASHALHVFMLHLPDFFDLPDAVSLAQREPELVRTGLELKRVGDRILRLLGGREVHPVNLCVGGFYRLPAPEELATLVPELARAEELAVAALERTGRLSFPEIRRDYHFVALHDPDRYAIERGDLLSSRGWSGPVAAYEAHLVERQVAYSTALHTRTRDGEPVLMGPLARFSLNYEQLPDEIQRFAARVGVAGGTRNPFRSVLVRLLEILYAIGEARRLIERLSPPPRSAVEVQPRAGTGHGATEAPRGICYHRYTIDARGRIEDAKIVPPTAVNQATMEGDLLEVVATSLEGGSEQLQSLCERAVRNHDPCISCATHFLRVEIEDA